MTHVIHNLGIEKGVPIVETRGRPTSEEYLTLIVMQVGESFVSGKSRHTLYQIARNLEIPVSIKSAGEQGWRVWKTGERHLTPKAERLLKKARKALIPEDEEE